MEILKKQMLLHWKPQSNETFFLVFSARISLNQLIVVEHHGGTIDEYGQFGVKICYPEKTSKLKPLKPMSISDK